MIEFLRPYAPDMAAWITHFAQVPAYYDANGHYARVLPIFNAFSFDQRTNTLNSLSPPSERQSQVTKTRPTASARAPAPSPRRTTPTRSSTTASSAPTTATRRRGRPDREPAYRA